MMNETFNHATPIGDTIDHSVYTFKNLVKPVEVPESTWQTETIYNVNTKHTSLVRKQMMRMNNSGSDKLPKIQLKETPIDSNTEIQDHSLM